MTPEREAELRAEIATGTGCGFYPGTSEIFAALDALRAENTRLREAATAQDFRMLESLALHHERNESPRCADDIRSLANRLRAALTPEAK